jgi:hypothetical protein
MQVHLGHKKGITLSDSLGSLSLGDGLLQIKAYLQWKLLGTLPGKLIIEMELMIICGLLFWCCCHPSSNPKELKKRKKNDKHTIDFTVAQMGCC